MIDLDFTLFGFTLLLLVVGVWYACTHANISGENDVEDDGKGNAPPVANVVRFRRRERRVNEDGPDAPRSESSSAP